MKVLRFLKLLRASLLIFCLISIGVLTSCRGYFTEEPPLDLMPNLDVQPKHKAQSRSRIPPGGVVSRSDGEYVDSARIQHGIVIAGDYLPVSNVGAFAEASMTQAPLPFDIRYLGRIPGAVNEDSVMRGMERFNIYCAVCHTEVGTGRSIVVGRGVGIPPPPDLSGSVVRAMTDGEIFNVITHGRRNMQGYATQVPVADRWAIVSYVRALQYSRTGSLADVPSGIREKLVKEIAAERAKDKEEISEETQKETPNAESETPSNEADGTTEDVSTEG